MRFIWWTTEREISIVQIGLGHSISSSNICIHELEKGLKLSKTNLIAKATLKSIHLKCEHFSQEIVRKKIQ